MTVVILGDTTVRSEHGFVREAIEDRGGDAVTVDVGEWPGGAPTEYTVGSGNCVLGTDIPFERVSGVFSMPRTVFEPSAPNLRDQYQDADTGDVYRHLSEWKGLFQSLVAVFEEHGAEVVTPPTESYWNAIEPWITGAYSRRSLPVPATVVTNEAERVREFVATHGEATIRPVNSREPPEVLDGPELEDEYVDRLTKSPAIIRETVSGVNVRSYVLKGELVGTCRYEHDSDPPLAPGRWLERMATSASEFTPSPSLRETVLEAAAFTPSSLTAVDLRVENDVECAVFDVRTSGRFVVADASGATDVAGALAEHLAAD